MSGGEGRIGEGREDRGGERGERGEGGGERGEGGGGRGEGGGGRGEGKKDSAALLPPWISSFSADEIQPDPRALAPPTQHNTVIIPVVSFEKPHIHHLNVLPSTFVNVLHTAMYYTRHADKYYSIEQ